MNEHLTRFCGAQGVTFTRSRPYQGNDNLHVEEKNNAVIRTFVEYGWHDPQGEEGLLNRLSLALHLMVNWFLSSQKLLRGKGPGAPSPRCNLAANCNSFFPSIILLLNFFFLPNMPVQFPHR